VVVHNYKSIPKVVVSIPKVVVRIFVTTVCVLSTIKYASIFIFDKH